MKKKKSKSGKASGSDQSELTREDNETLARVSAAIVLDRLYRQDLDWVSFRYPLAENAEHFVIGGSSRVDAYLIAWKEWPGILKYTDFKGGSRNSVNRLAQLVAAYKTLCKDFEEPVYIHLVSNDHAATDKIRGCPGPQFHLANFLTNEWRRYRESVDEGDWQSVWAGIAGAVDLEGDDFEQFVDHCRFDLGYPLPSYDPDQGEEQPLQQACAFHRPLVLTRRPWRR